MADKHRRRSMNIFRPKMVPSPPIPIPAPMAPAASTQSDETRAHSDGADAAPRPTPTQKSSRSTVFGSLRSIHSFDDDERVNLLRSDSQASSLRDDGAIGAKSLLGSRVLRYGDIQVAGGNVFRKRTHFIVLTESHLIRFRSQARAAEMFSSIPIGLVKGHVPRTSSAGSHQELQMAAYSDITSGISLDQVLAVYRIDESRPFVTVEVAYHDDGLNRSSVMQLHLAEPREAQVWVSTIRSSVSQARSQAGAHIRRQTMEHLARVLEREGDYDPEHFRAFHVVQRCANKSLRGTSSDDLHKSGSTVCYLIVGLHKIHLVPAPRSSSRSSNTSLADLDTGAAFAIVNLTSIRVQHEEDAFHLTFKPPMGPGQMVQLASCAVDDVALALRYASEYLRPEWLKQPFVFDVPSHLEDQVMSPHHEPEADGCFDRTLIAYCAGYGVDTSRVCYSVDYHCEDAPCFQLLRPSTESSYSALELLAIFRALRYNESFTSVSFAGINLSPLRHWYDAAAFDLDGLSTRSGHPTNIPGQQELPLLGQEIRALALKSRRLRRLDFSYCLPPTALIENQQSLDCGIMEALAPLCKKSLTNVDWVILTGLRLADSDLNFLVDAASERQCHFRALEIGECGLSIHDIDVLLSALAVQESTVEVIDISGAQGRFSPELFHREIGAFTRLRRLDLTRVQKTAGSEPLVAPDALLAWRLEALHLSQTTLNDQSVDAIASYLATPKSEILRELHVNQCGLSGRDLATFFRSMSRSDQMARIMHVSANENRLKRGFSALVEAISHSQGPSSLSMRMMDFEKETHFRELIDALTANTTLRSLDISRASLPYDASLETCEALKDMFAHNTSLEELDISGEQAHLDATRFGIGLNVALRGLKRNRSLKLLRIEYQSLGFQGASTLAEVLATNTTLAEIHCEHNDINLQSFTVLVDALEHNSSLLYMSSMDHDRAKSMENVRREIETMDRAESPKPGKAAGTMKKTLASALGGLTVTKAGRPPAHHRHNRSISSSTSFTDHDVTAVMAALDERWDEQVARMQRYLFRNACHSQGVPCDDIANPPTEHGLRKSQSGSGSSIMELLQGLSLDKTPTLELRSPLELIMPH